MKPTFDATTAALAHFDAVSQPALNVMRKSNGSPVNFGGYVDARKVAADRVRAAYLQDTEHFNTEENVKLMSVERIRRAVSGTILGKMLGMLP